MLQQHCAGKAETVSYLGDTKIIYWEVSSRHGVGIHIHCTIFFSFKKKKRKKEKEREKKALQQRILARVQQSWQLMVQYYHMTEHHKHETRKILQQTVWVCCLQAAGREAACSLPRTVQYAKRLAVNRPYLYYHCGCLLLLLLYS